MINQAFAVDVDLPNANRRKLLPQKVLSFIGAGGGI